MISFGAKIYDFNAYKTGKKPAGQSPPPVPLKRDDFAATSRERLDNVISYLDESLTRTLALYQGQIPYERMQFINRKPYYIFKLADGNKSDSWKYYSLYMDPSYRLKSGDAQGPISLKQLKGKHSSPLDTERDGLQVDFNNVYYDFIVPPVNCIEEMKGKDPHGKSFNCNQQDKNIGLSIEEELLIDNFLTMIRRMDRVLTPDIKLNSPFTSSPPPPGLAPGGGRK